MTEDNKMASYYAKRKEFWECWTLHSQKGRQRWQFQYPSTVNSDELKQQFLEDMAKAFVFDKAENVNTSDLVFRLPKQKNAEIRQSATTQDTFTKGARFYASLQESDGHWPGDYGGPHFLNPGLVIVSYITQTPLQDSHSVLIKRYMLNHQNKDGGWGLHIEGESTMFGTVLQYVALRLLGADKNSFELKKAREWILREGGAVYAPSWAKFYLSALGVYEWEGCNTLIPELWLLPRNWPIHPGNYWCHTRMVYMPMSYCYGARVTGEITELVKEIRTEIYTEPYANIKWSRYRFAIHEKDSYVKPSWLLKKMYGILNVFEKNPVRKWRKKALSFLEDYIHAEDEHTNYINIGPVNQVINSLAVWHFSGKKSEAFKRHVERWYDYLWVAEDGMKMNGYNGSQLWDAAFAAQALLEGNATNVIPEAMQKVLGFIDVSQVREEVREHKKYFRHDSVGGWPFSTAEHGWPITDCTAEGLSSVLAFFEKGMGLDKITFARLAQSVDLILSFQNSNGGWASYELQRSGKWIEFMNPAEVFGDIMVDYPYTECSSACIRALCEFRQHYPEYRRREIDEAVSKGISFIKQKQLPDGSWRGSWAVCFTYATWFGLTALAVAGEGDSEAARQGCAFLLSKQKADGSWGEAFESCVKREYIEHHEGQSVNTAWALLGLMACNYPARDQIEKGIRFLAALQSENGDWPQQSVSGVFNFSCAITYTAYRNVFPLWALARYNNMYGPLRLI